MTDTGYLDAIAGERADDGTVGYRGPTVVALTGMSYRQLDYAVRQGWIEPSIRAASGSGSQRLFDKFDIAVIRVAAALQTQRIPPAQSFALAAHLLAGGTHRVVLANEFELIIRPIIPTA